MVRRPDNWPQGSRWEVSSIAAAVAVVVAFAVAVAAAVAAAVAIAAAVAHSDHGTGPSYFWNGVDQGRSVQRTRRCLQRD